MVVVPEGDALQLAHDLMCQIVSTPGVAGSLEQSVMILNGATRKALGNHWYDHRQAHHVIDEGLHRRSWTMAATSLVLNAWKPRSASRWLEHRGSLRERVREVGGKVFVLSS